MHTGIVPVPKATSFLSHGTLDTNSRTITVQRGYRAGYIRVYLNGAFLPPDQYTATDGSTIDFGIDLPAGTDWIVDEARTFIPAEFGNAALRDVGLDPGELMEVGAYGIGGKAQSGNDIFAFDFNTVIDRSGFYTSSGQWSNGPLGNPAGHTGMLFNLYRVYGNMVYQEFFVYGTGETYHRAGNPSEGTWGEWRRIADSGSTPDFAGMPTVGGAPIIESGSNTDGNWMRWADGTQTCSGKKGAGSYSDDGDQYYPVSFISAPSVTASMSHGSVRKDEVQGIGLGNVDRLNVFSYYPRYQIVGGGYGVPVQGFSWFATGRWK